MQAKLTVSGPDDPDEREAEAVAEHVSRMPLGHGASIRSSAAHVQRMCASCHEEEAHVQRMCAGCRDEEEEAHVQRRADASAGIAAPAAAAATIRSAGPGAPLPAADRAYFEPRFGRDFGDVRIHTGHAAASAARMLSARAFTRGHDVMFGSGEYVPGSERGRQLLAHELVHVIQQQHRAEPRLQRAGEPGTTEFVETPIGPAMHTGGVWRGDVRREVFAPASGTDPRERVHVRVVPVEFDSSACEVRLPHAFAFVSGPSTSPDICEGPPPLSEPVPPVSGDRLAKIGSDYVEAVNEGLNDWFVVRMDGDACSAPCAGRDIPIRAVASVAAPGPDTTTITVVNRGGRADAATLCEPDISYHTMVHEGGHQVLGAGDEYREPSSRVLAGAPEWGREERVRTDWSRMHEDYGRFTLFHARHFGHVPAFLDHAFPGCGARLVEVGRFTPDFRLGLGVGFLYSGSAGEYLDVGLEMGIPLSRLRDWELVIGAHGRMLAELQDDTRLAFLLGARLGFEHRWSPAVGGFRVGGFTEVGGGWFQPPGRPLAGAPEYVTAPYGEVGLTAGYRFGFGPLGLRLDTEVAGGTALTPTDVPPEYREVVRDEDTMRWFRAGLSLTAEF